METRYWETLRLVAELGSFSKAASRLHITQSAASRRVAILEDHYGTPLLDRSGGDVACTEAGRVVIEFARRILTLEYEIDASMKQLSGGKKVAFGCTPGFAATYLQSLLERAATAGNLTITLGATQDLIADYEAGALDVVVFEHCNLGNLPEDQRLNLEDDDLVFVTSSTREVAISSAEELFSETLYCCPGRCCTRMLLESNLGRSGHSISAFERVVELDDLHVLRSSLREPGAVAFVSRALVAADIEAGRLHEHTLPGHQHSRPRTILARDRSQLELWYDMVSEVVAMEQRC